MSDHKIFFHFDQKISNLNKATTLTESLLELDEDGPHDASLGYRRFVTCMQFFFFQLFILNLSNNFVYYMHA